MPTACGHSLVSEENEEQRLYRLWLCEFTGHPPNNIRNHQAGGDPHTLTFRGMSGQLSNSIPPYVESPNYQWGYRR